MKVCYDLFLTTPFYKLVLLLLHSFVLHILGFYVDCALFIFSYSVDNRHLWFYEAMLHFTGVFFCSLL